MKVLVVTPHFLGGGAERVAVLLANGLQANGNDVFLYAFADEGPNRSFIDPGVSLIIASDRSKVKIVIDLANQCKRLGVQAIISHQTQCNFCSILAKTIYHLKIPVICVEHGEIRETRKFMTGLSSDVIYSCLPIVYPFAHRILGVSQNVSDSVARWCRPFRVRTQIMPNPVVYPHMETMSANEPQHKWLKVKSGPVFVAIGRLEHQKNIDLLIDAFALFGAERNARLIIFGEGSLRNELEAKVDRLGLRDHVDLPGYTQNPFAELNAADALVLSSRWEGLPTVAIEAIFLGKQVVSTDNSSGIHEILQSGSLGWITPQSDPPALASAMLQALDDPFPVSQLKDHAKTYDYRHVAGLYLNLVSA